MSRGLTASTPGLKYSRESGGLNEATSDIFGTAVEFYDANSSDVGDYFIGEKIDINGNGTPLRYMDKPNKDGASAELATLARMSTLSLSPLHFSAEEIAEVVALYASNPEYCRAAGEYDSENIQADRVEADLREENNPAALTFWSSLGWQEIDRRADRQHGRPCIVMHKQLT